MSVSTNSKLLGEIVRFGNGKSVKPGGEGLYPVYGSNGTIGASDKFLHENGIIIGRVGAYCGAVTYCPGRFWASDNTLVAFPANDGVDIEFLYYLLHEARLSRYAGGAAQPLVTQTVLKQVEVQVPSITAQRRIAGILSAYDELIENSQRRIRILESMARALYREWFVHFRFPGHENHPKVPSPLGDIPEGWAVSEFRDLFDIKYGRTLPKTEIQLNGFIPVYGAGDVIGFYDQILCSEKCVLVTCRGNGSGTVWRTRGPAFVTNNSLMIRPQSWNREWHYSFIQFLLENANILSAKTGSAQPQITIENLNYVRSLVPTIDLVRTFGAACSPLLDAVDILWGECQVLRRTRDLLLPRLLSGQVDLGES